MMTVVEMVDYVEGYDYDGITLTEVGIGAAKIILERRKDWTDAHGKMLGRLLNGEKKVPLKLRRLVNGTRLGDALELSRSIARHHIRNQKQKARATARAARAKAA